MNQLTPDEITALRAKAPGNDFLTDILTKCVDTGRNLSEKQLAAVRKNLSGVPYTPRAATPFLATTKPAPGVDLSAHVVLIDEAGKAFSLNGTRERDLLTRVGSRVEVTGAIEGWTSDVSLERLPEDVPLGGAHVRQ